MLLLPPAILLTSSRRRISPASLRGVTKCPNILRLKKSHFTRTRNCIQIQSRACDRARDRARRLANLSAIEKSPEMQKSAPKVLIEDPAAFARNRLFV
jgi:hypothetical protein